MGASRSSHSRLHYWDNKYRNKTPGEQTDELTPQECVLLSDFLLPMILKDISLSDLKNFRLVNSLWYEVASRIILKKNRLIHHIDISDDSTNIRKRTKATSLLRRADEYTKPNEPSSVLFLIREVEVVLEFEQKSSTLEKLSKSMKNSTLFPCDYFHFNQVNFKDEALKQFVERNGEYIKHLSFSYPFLFHGIDVDDLKTFNDNDSFLASSVVEVKISALKLFKQCSKIEILSILSDICWEGYSSEASRINPGKINKSLKLKKDLVNSSWEAIQWNCLKILNVCYEPPAGHLHHIPLNLIRNILRAAPNLTAINPQCLNFDDKIFRMYIELDAFHLFQKFGFWFNRFKKSEIASDIEAALISRLELYEAIVEKLLKLEHIIKIQTLSKFKTRPDVCKMIARILNKSFQANSSTLKSITNCGPLELYQGLKFPFLPSLKYWEFSLKVTPFDCLHKILPTSSAKGQNYGELFPHLSTVEIQYDYRDYFIIVFDSGNEHPSQFTVFSHPFPNVRTLRLKPKVETLQFAFSAWLPNLSVVFPNVTNLSLQVFNVREFHRAWKMFVQFEFDCQNWRTLTELTFTVYLAKDENLGFYLIFDTLSKDEITSYLKDLRKLRINVQVATSFDFQSSYMLKTLSQVAEEFSLHNLKVNPFLDFTIAVDRPEISDYFRSIFPPEVNVHCLV